MADSETFQYFSYFDCNKEELYDLHSRAGALERLIPPWENTSVVSRKGGIEPGGEVVMRMHAGPIPFRWVAHHVEHTPGEMFRDIMHTGPFSSWSHSHLFFHHATGSCLEDRIVYSLPFHSFLPKKIRSMVEDTLYRTFHHRQKVLSYDLALHRRCSQKPLKVLVSGASGVLGRALSPLLTTGGHEVWTLVRREPRPEAQEIFWDPAAGQIEELPHFDCVIHLAGEYIGLGRWTSGKKREVIESRTKGTALLVEAMKKMEIPPKVFLSASAVGYYGDTKYKNIDENRNSGDDFISEVCRLWEEAALSAEGNGIRTVLMRIGISLSPQGGALQRLLKSSPLGFFKRFGTGEQYISWISLDDTISAIYHAMCCDQLEGPVNITAPEPLQNNEFMQILADVVGRPLTLPVPERILKAVYGQMAQEILLSGCRASCKKLEKSGFIFRHPTLREALIDMLGKFEGKNTGIKRG